MFKALFSLLILFTPLLLAVPPPPLILFKMRQGFVEQAISSYQAHAKQKGSHDYALLQQMALALIQDSSRKENHDLQLLSLWASAFSMNTNLLHVLAKGLEKEDPRDILATLFFLMSFPDDHAVNLIRKELNSPWLPIQATAAEFLIQKKEKGILEIVARWLERLDPRAYPIFVPLFAASEERFAICWMRKFLHASNVETRLIALLEIGKRGRDDLLEEVREAAKTGNLQEKEAAATTLGSLGDSASISLLKELTHQKEPAIQLAASYSLFLLGQLKAEVLIQDLAIQGNLFAIGLLGQMNTGIDLLIRLSKSTDFNIKANATIALLKAKNSAALPALLSLLHPNLKNMALIGITSPGRSLIAWQMKPRITLKNQLVSIFSKQRLIEEAATLSEKEFLVFAKEAILFEDKETVPALIWTVKNYDKQFLINQLNRPGAPLARSWATLALYTMKEKGPYAEHVYAWFVEMKKLAIVAITPPSLTSDLKSFHLMNKQDSCQLLLSALDSVAGMRDKEAIDFVLAALIEGNPLNRPVLASLLLRLSE
ncbi:MAG: HEAT repeat domain-containing protein [Chlamydiae bacterium]|nr:HEAT repeat domain-containing protein [Chlamydiota bacterium]